MGSPNDFTVKVKMTTINCGVCGGTYAINSRFHEQCQEQGKAWNCPYCQCGWGFTGNSENQRLKKELEQEKRRREEAAKAAENARRQRDRAERRRRAQKAQTTKLRNRAKAGECVYCCQHIDDLEAHMKEKHPDAVGTPPTE